VLQRVFTASYTNLVRLVAYAVAMKRLLQYLRTALLMMVYCLTKPASFIANQD
jgi:hypothetical protein